MSTATYTDLRIGVEDLPIVPLTPTMQMLANLVAAERYVRCRTLGLDTENMVDGENPAAPDTLGAIGEIVVAAWLGGIPHVHWNAVLDTPDPGVDLVLPGGYTVDVKYVSRLLGPFRLNRKNDAGLKAHFGVVVYPHLPEDGKKLVTDPPTYIIGGVVSRSTFDALAQPMLDGSGSMGVTHSKLTHPRVLMEFLARKDEHYAG